MMDSIDQIDREQERAWNGPGGRAWAEAQSLLDDMFRPFQRLLAGVEPSEPDGALLDVGCGCGSTTLAAARAHRGRQCVGIDISRPMLDIARARAWDEGLAAEFICADAQTHMFELARFGTIISRFGVMFFDDSVGAFANLRHAIRPDGRLRFIAWRRAADNPFMTIAERTAAPYLPGLPIREPGAPGQFAFADRDRVHNILKDAGWKDVDIQPIDVACTLPENQLVGYFTRLGPVGLHLQQADHRLPPELVSTIRAAFDPHVHGDEVRFDAACWLVDARPA